MKPNCYECKYRGSVPGDAHSCCKHPGFSSDINNPMAQAMAILAGVGRIAPVHGQGSEYKGEKVIVKGSIHGIRHGWFNHPWNFDPVWLEECNGFEAKEKEGVR